MRRIYRDEFNFFCNINIVLTKSRTGSEHVCADLGGVEVVMDEGVDEGGDLALDDEVAGGLKVGDDLTEAGAELSRNQDEFLSCFGG